MVYFVKNNIQYLLLRFDNIDDWISIFNFIDISYKPVKKNISECKKYNKLYKLFKKNYFVSKNSVDIIYKYNKEYLNYFYTPEEIDIHLNYWYKLDTGDNENILPNNFNPSTYKLLNNDLNFMNDYQLTLHYIVYGQYENRHYK